MRAWVTAFFRRIQVPLAVVTLAALSTGCSTMQLPQRLSQSQVLVETSGGFLSEREYFFEDWSVTDVQREYVENKRLKAKYNWTETHNTLISTQYDFDLMFKGEVKYRVECYTRYDDTGFSLMGFTVSRDMTILKCGILNPTTGALDGELQSMMEKEGMRGVTTMGDSQLNIYSQFTSASNSFVKPTTPYGYILHGDDGAVAAIQLTHDRFIWMHPSGRENSEDHIAAALMALAYYVTLTPRME